MESFQAVAEDTVKDVPELEEASGPKLHIVLPSCDDKFTSQHVAGQLELSRLLVGRKIPHAYLYHTGGSHISGARNETTKTFLRGNAEVMFFIDDDIGFRGADAIHMYDAIVAEGKDRGVIGGTYARKRLQLDEAYKAAKGGCDYETFRRTLLEYNLLIQDGKARYMPGENLLQSTHAPTGFLMIRRWVFEKLAEKFPDNMMDGEMFNYFGYGPAPGDKNQWGEDYYFSQLCRLAGIDIWIYLGAKLSHRGMYTYEGLELP